MKKNKIIFGIICLCALMSCNKDFLVKTPPDALPEDGFYNSADRAIQAVNAAYATLESDNLYSDNLSKILSGSSGDIVISNTTGVKFTSFSYTAADPILMDVYSTLYQGVYRTNKVLAAVPDIEMEEPLKKRILGEAKFLRALYYWHLTTLWGEVPLFTKPFEKPSDALVAKSPVKDIYAVMVQDLKYASSALPVSYQGANVGRATKGAAQALLGKVYLYDKDYKNALKYLDSVIVSGTYALDANFNNVINRDHENDQESVFEVQFKAIGAADVGSLRDWYNLPQGAPGGFGNDLPNQSIVDEFESYSGSTAIDDRDPRLFYSIFRNGDPFLPNSSNAELKTYNKDWSATGYNIRKGIYPVKLTNQPSGTNFPIIRYAGVLLMYAEAACKLNMLNEARDAVNQVRQRPSVMMPKLTVASTNTKDKMFEAIVHERRVELCFEYQRFNDLRRWGMAKTVLGSAGYTDRNRYFPLPQEELDVNPQLVQEEGW